MSRFLLLVSLIISFLGVPIIAGATPEVYENWNGQYYVAPPEWTTIASITPPDGLNHYYYYTWGLEDLTSPVGGLRVVFKGIYDWTVEDDWLNVYLFDNENDKVALGWHSYGDGQSTELPDWSSYNSATHVGTWSDPYGTSAKRFDVVFEITAAELLGYTGNGKSCAIGIDPDCHYWPREIRIEAVAEPGTMILLGFGLMGLATMGRKRLIKS